MSVIGPRTELIQGDVGRARMPSLVGIIFPTQKVLETQEQKLKIKSSGLGRWVVQIYFKQRITGIRG